MISKLLLYFLYCVHFPYVYLEYTGNEFPAAYLEVDEMPTLDDLELYLDRLGKIRLFLVQRLNATEVHEIIGAYFSKALLKKTLKDYGFKLKNYQESIKTIIHDEENVISHYNYMSKVYYQNQYTFGYPLADDDALLYSMGSFNRNVLQKWINTKETLKLNEFISSMDNLSLSKEKYTELTLAGRVRDSINYTINAHVSDNCLQQLYEDMDPYDLTTLRPCKNKPLCRHGVLEPPSVAYSLSHRLLLHLQYFTNRRCYLRSPELDAENIDQLCAAMYREAVYLSRRGYFFRDLFMEHVALCAVMGYEEFHRRRWFRKTASWVRDDGCMEESWNYEVNRTRLDLSKMSNAKEKEKYLSRKKQLYATKCFRHQMALASIVMANGVRHAAHYL